MPACDATDTLVDKTPMYRVGANVVKKLRAVTVNAKPKAITIWPQIRNVGVEEKKMKRDPKTTTTPLTTVIRLSTCAECTLLRLRYREMLGMIAKSTSILAPALNAMR
ncbi:hypothetical protein N7519_005995 [Penicillium mononematosum]|uniref:uncharacterized protein n=1 Tax=Penicillium mononematosum TaxID=268346 RepID=UPI00254849E6|nr:uncharacterized protein N7519_005995 [Penicillium mononematosum]KAJ6184694.1 hypothetical protein N7519_005995 [Penicillium mononematosum]